jgi:hypothetical protein
MELHIDDHSPSHSLIKITLPLPLIPNIWAIALALYHLEQFPSLTYQAELKGRNRNEDSRIKQDPIICSGSCNRFNPLGKLFKCLELGCQGM